jgi:putative transposase
MDNKKVGKYDLNKYGVLQARDFPFADELNSMARLASAERAGSSISRFYDNCKKGNPQFQKNCRSVEYKSSGWKLASDRKSINLTD